MIITIYKRCGHAFYTAGYLLITKAGNPKICYRPLKKARKFQLIKKLFFCRTENDVVETRECILKTFFLREIKILAVYREQPISSASKNKEKLVENKQSRLFNSRRLRSYLEHLFEDFIAVGVEIVELEVLDILQYGSLSSRAETTLCVSTFKKSQ